MVYHGALPLTHRHYHSVHYHSTTTVSRALLSLAGRQAGWPGTPDFAEWRGAKSRFRGMGCGSKIQIPRNGRGTQNTEITGVGGRLNGERKVKDIQLSKQL